MIDASPCKPADEAALVASLLDWWRLAGLDTPCADDARDWRQPLPAAATGTGNAASSPAPATGRGPAAPAPLPGPRPAARLEPPATPDAFADWWMGEPLLATGIGAVRVAPRLVADAPILICCDMPQADDRETLLDGSAGAMLDAILAALGVPPERISVVSLLAEHTLAPDWRQMAAIGAGDVLASQVRMLRPRAVMALGEQAHSALSRNGLPDSDGNLRDLNHQGASLPLFRSPHPALLAMQPALKARAWRHWLELVDKVDM